MKSFTIPSFDGYPISIHEFSSSTTNHKTIVFAPAVAVPQKIYFNMAEQLATMGCNVYTFDYRGIGSSNSKSIKSLKEYGYFSWAKDFKEVSKYVKECHPNNKQYMIGHSYGGNSLGFSDSYQYYDKYITIASQYGYYKYFKPKMQLLILLNFGVFVPITTFLLGYYPSGWFGLGHPLPTKAVKDWSKFLLHPDSMLYFTKENNTTYSKVYSNAQITRKHIKPKDFNLKAIGHFDFFRKKNQDILWPIVYNWFDL